MSELFISRVIGTSARSPNKFTVCGDMLAYTASGGVVVGRLENGQVTRQRFFCANSEDEGDDEGTETDAYGFPIVSKPQIVASASGEREESPSKLKDRVRSVNCLCIAPSKQLLLVGEVGYQPRILVFSLAPNSNRKPVVVIHEHAFGLKALAFSPDSQCFCSLGVVNDGAINVWRVLPGLRVELIEANRCSADVYSLVWHENSIICSGLRFIKVWAPERPDRLAVLKGKNVVLGDSLRSCFDLAVPISSDEVLVSTTKKELFLLRLGTSAKLVPLKSVPFGFGAFAADDKGVWFGVEKVGIREEEQENKGQKESKSKDLARESESILAKELEDSSDEKKTLQESLQEPQEPSQKSSQEPSQEPLQEPQEPLQESQESFPSCIFIPFSSLIPTSHPCPSPSYSGTILKMALHENTQICLHKDAIVMHSQSKATVLASSIKSLAGVKKTSASLLAFSSCGSVREVTGSLLYKLQLPQFDVIPNELTALDFYQGELALGDKYGWVYLVENGAIKYQEKAHSSSVNELAFINVDGHTVLVSIARDRMIQVYTKAHRGWDIHQTLPIHNGNLLDLVHKDGRLFVSSSDRTISVHRLQYKDTLAVYQEKIIALKATPMCMCLHSNDLIVALTDKNVHVYDTSTLELKRSFTLVSDKSDKVLVERMVAVNGRIFTSCSDRSLRGFSYPSGKPLCVGWGHSDCITSLVAKSPTQLLSAGTNGCLFEWDVRSPPVEEASVPDPETPVHRKVTRRIMPALHVERKEEKEKENTPEPAPRLTAATMKRLERLSKSPQKLSRKSSNISLNESPVRDARRMKQPTVPRTSRPSSPSPGRVGFESPVKMGFESPTKMGGLSSPKIGGLSSPKIGLSSSFIDRSQSMSPTKGPTKEVRSSTKETKGPTKETKGTKEVRSPIKDSATRNDSSNHGSRILDPSPSKINLDISSNLNLSSRSIDNTSVNPMSPFESSMRSLSLLPGALESMSSYERRQVLGEMQTILRKYDVESTGELLERYSDRLVAMVEHRLGRKEKATSLLNFGGLD